MLVKVEHTLYFKGISKHTASFLIFFFSFFFFFKAVSEGWRVGIMVKKPCFCRDPGLVLSTQMKAYICNSSSRGSDARTDLLRHYEYTCRHTYIHRTYVLAGKVLIHINK